MGDAVKYLLLEVPNYLASTNLGTAVNSYLCLGQPGDDLPGYGEDLATVVTDFADDQRAREGKGATNAPPAEAYPGPAGFEQSLDPSLPAPASTGLGPDGRSAESSILHTKGGWRDHSDGNRITTTRGDKVEVIRGNYRMVVLGRRDPGGTTTGPAAPTSTNVVDPTSTTGLGGFISEEAGDTPGTIAAPAKPPPAPNDLTNAVSMDISGGLVDVETYLATDSGQSSDQTALSTAYVWAQDSNGRWGWTQRTQTGTYYGDPTNDARQPPGNGKTIAYTWVDEIWAFRGSPNPDPFVAPGFDPTTKQSVDPNTWDTTDPNNTVTQPIKKIWSADWAELIHQETNATQIAGSPGPVRLETAQTSAGTLQSDTVSTGDMVLNTQTTGGGTLTLLADSSGELKNTLSSSGHMTNVTTTTDSITESYVSHGYHMVTDSSMGAISNEAMAGGMIMSLNAAGGIVTGANLAVGMVSSFEIALMLSEIHIGIIQLEQRLGMHQDTHLGVHADTHKGMHQDVHVGIHNEVHVGAHNQFATIKTVGHEMLISNAQIWSSAAETHNLGMPGATQLPSTALPDTGPTPPPDGAAPAAAAAAPADAAPAAGTAGAAVEPAAAVGAPVASTAPIWAGYAPVAVVGGVAGAEGIGGVVKVAAGPGDTPGSSVAPPPAGSEDSATLPVSPPLKSQSTKPTPEAAEDAKDPKKPGPWEDL